MDYQFLKGKINVQFIKNIDINVSPFWYKALDVWFENKMDNLSEYENNKIEKISDNEVLFNNVAFQYKNKHIWIYECIKFGIIRLKDVMINDRVMNLNEFREKFPNLKQVVFAHNIIFNACKKYEGMIERNCNSDHKIYFKGRVVGDIGRKGFFKMLKRKEESHIIAFWKRKLEVDIEKEHWIAGIQSSKETRLQEHHWKIMHNIYPTNILLHKMKVKENNNCEFCSVEDYIEHFFVHCNKVKPVWIEIEKQLMSILNKKVELTVCDKLIGIKASEKGVNITEKKHNKSRHSRRKTYYFKVSIRSEI